MSCGQSLLSRGEKYMFSTPGWLFGLKQSFEICSSLLYFCCKIGGTGLRLGVPCSLQGW